MSKKTPIQSTFRRKQKGIPGLDTVTLKDISLGDLVDVEELIEEVDEDIKHNIFVNHVLARMTETPSLTSEEVAALPNSSVEVLLDAAVDIFDMRKEFDALPSTLDSRERFYKAHQVHLSNMMKPLAEAAGQALARVFQSISFQSPMLPDISNLFNTAPLKEALSLHVPIKPVLFDMLQTSGINTPLVHSPTYTFPKPEKPAILKSGSDEDTERAILLDAYDIIMQLERSLRELIETKLREIHGDAWWKRGVPEAVRNGCETRKQEKEKVPSTEYTPSITLM